MNIKKIISYFIAFIFVLAISGFIVSKTEAYISFPAGCSSAIGNSVTTGSPCNGATTPTLPINGCVSPLGYSTVDGAICSGSSEVLWYLGGCVSGYDYSLATGAPCNGTATAYIYYDTTPGLPTTGVSALSLVNMILLLLSGLLTIGVIAYALRRTKTA